MITPYDIALINTAWEAIQDHRNGSILDCGAITIHTGWCDKHQTFELTVLSDNEMIACTDIPHKDAFHEYCRAVFLMSTMMRNAVRLVMKGEQPATLDTDIDRILRDALGE